MKEVNIKGKFFTEEEICDYGKKSIAKTRKILIIIGLSLVTCAFVLVGICVDSGTGESMIIEDILPPSIIYGVSGIVLIVLSFVKAKKDPYAAGVAFLNKHFPYPVGFDGNIADSLKGDKIIELSKSPASKLIILSSENKFQVVQGNTYSKIFNGQDILEYEIRVDNEVVITSRTKSKNGVGKALVGGALFGGAGLIAGAVAGNGTSKTSQSQKEMHHYILVLKVNDILNPSFVIELSSLQRAEEVAATFAIICQCENKIEKGDKFEFESDKNASQLDKFDEIKKYKELLDIGIITQEEFENKKKNLLG